MVHPPDVKYHPVPLHQNSQEPPQLGGGPTGGGGTQSVKTLSVSKQGSKSPTTEGYVQGQRLLQLLATAFQPKFPFIPLGVHAHSQPDSGQGASVVVVLQSQVVEVGTAVVVVVQETDGSMTPAEQ